jgi:hypothetical protein
MDSTVSDDSVTLSQYFQLGDSNNEYPKTNGFMEEFRHSETTLTPTSIDEKMLTSLIVGKRKPNNRTSIADFFTSPRNNGTLGTTNLSKIKHTTQEVTFLPTSNSSDSSISGTSPISTKTTNTDKDLFLKQSRVNDTKYMTPTTTSNKKDNSLTSSSVLSSPPIATPLPMPASTKTYPTSNLSYKNMTHQYKPINVTVLYNSTDGNQTSFSSPVLHATTESSNKTDPSFQLAAVAVGSVGLALLLVSRTRKTCKTENEMAKQNGWFSRTFDGDSSIVSRDKDPTRSPGGYLEASVVNSSTQSRKPIQGPNHFVAKNRSVQYQMPSKSCQDGGETYTTDGYLEHPKWLSSRLWKPLVKTTHPYSSTDIESAMARGAAAAMASDDTGLSYVEDDTQNNKLIFGDVLGLEVEPSKTFTVGQSANVSEYKDKDLLASFTGTILESNASRKPSKLERNQSESSENVSGKLLDIDQLEFNNFNKANVGKHRQRNKRDVASILRRAGETNSKTADEGYPSRSSPDNESNNQLCDVIEMVPKCTKESRPLRMPTEQLELDGFTVREGPLDNDYFENSIRSEVESPISIDTTMNRVKLIKNTSSNENLPSRTNDLEAKLNNPDHIFSVSTQPTQQKLPMVDSLAHSSKDSFLPVSFNECGSGSDMEVDRSRSSESVLETHTRTDRKEFMERDNDELEYLDPDIRHRFEDFDRLLTDMIDDLNDCNQASDDDIDNHEISDCDNYTSSDDCDLENYRTDVMLDTYSDHFFHQKDVFMIQNSTLTSSRASSSSVQNLQPVDSVYLGSFESHDDQMSQNPADDQFEKACLIGLFDGKLDENDCCTNDSMTSNHTRRTIPIMEVSPIDKDDTDTVSDVSDQEIRMSRSNQRRNWDLSKVLVGRPQLQDDNDEENDLVSLDNSTVPMHQTSSLLLAMNTQCDSNAKIVTVCENDLNRKKMHYTSPTSSRGGRDSSSTLFHSVTARMIERGDVLEIE